MTSHEVQHWRILGELESGGTVSQRTLSQRLGIALGLTNQLVRELVDRGLIRLNRAGARIRYEITRSGVTHHRRLTRKQLDGVMRAYADARFRIEERLASLVSEPGGRNPLRRVVVYDDGHGAAEVGCMCLQRQGLIVVGVISDSGRSSRMLGDVSTWEDLSGRELSGRPFDRLVVMSFLPAAAIRAQLRRRRVPRGVTFWI